LGAIYENGLDGYKVNYKKAAQYYTEANTANAQYRLANLYLNGLIGKQTEKDIATGMDYLNQSASAGNIDAIYDLGHCYAYGIYVDTIDQDKAVECFRTLAESEVPAGIFMMGLYYEGAELSAPSVPADSVKALQCMQKASELDYNEAKCYLADYYRAGQFVPQDKAKAFNLYENAYESGSANGAYYVGRSYLEGCGVEIDSSRAIPYLKEASAKGIHNAAYRIAEFYNYGLGGLPADGDSALAYYLTAHQNGNGAASFVIGQALINEGSYTDAFEFFHTGAQRGDVNAGIALAACLQNGIGIEEADPKAAYKLYENIANTSHDARAYGALGLACLQGNGCPEDDNLGKAYLDTAVSLGHEASLFYLGACYLSGLGCRADTATAISWLEKAADNENIRAINTLGDIYRQQGELKNAVLYYEKAVTLGSLEGYCNLGYCYQEGLGVVLNSQKAYELYKFAADHEYNRAYRMLASCYTNGIYVEPSMAEALNWLTKAADNGDVIAMYYCGSILEEGDEGVPADKKKAREWYKKAATAGYEPAQVALSRMK
jgi:TPR repeat protein